MIRKKFLKSCAVAALLCGFAQSVPAAEINAPKADWVVGPITAKGDNGLKYCSMKNSYQNGHMLVFARDGSGSNSLAMDLKKNALEVGRQYGVTVRSGVLTRRVSAIAATKQVMIMQMGVDKAFYEALKDKGKISFQTGSDTHTFNFDTGLAEALKTLADCSDSLQSGAKFARVTVPLGKIRPEDKIEPAEETVVKTASSPAARIDRRSTKIGEDTSEVPSLSALAMNSGLRDELERLRIENKKLIRENQEVQARLLEQEFSSLRERPKAAPKQESLKAELNRLRAENQKMAQVSQAGQDEIRAEIARIRAENDRLARAFQAGRDETREETQRLKEENERLARATHVRPVPEVIPPTTVRAKPIAEVIPLAPEPGQGALITEAARLKVQNEQAIRVAQEAQESLRLETERLRAENERLAQAAQARQLAQAEQESLKVEAARLQAENEKALRLAQEAQENLRAEAARLRAENEKLAQAAQAEQEALKAEAARLAQEKQERLQVEATQLKVENEKLAQEAREAQAELKAEVLAESRHHVQPVPPVAAVSPPVAVAAQLIPAPAVREETLGALPSLASYQWVEDDIYGAAQELPWVSGKTFGEMADDYISQAASLCQGEFAQRKGEIRKEGEVEILESELVCLDGQNDAAAAVLFVSDQGKFNIVTQEGTVEQMPTALLKRDSMLSLVTAGS